MFETSLGNVVKSCLYKKEKKEISREWWHVPVFPATWEAEAGGSQGQEFKTSLAKIETLSLLKIKKLAR